MIYKRGKSGKQKDEIINELRKEIGILNGKQKLRDNIIKKLREENSKRLPKQLVVERERDLRQEKNKKLTNLKVKVRNRDSKVEDIKGEKETLSLLLKEKDKQLKEAGDKLTKAEISRNKALGVRRRIKRVYSKTPMTTEAKRLEKIVNNGITDGKYNVFANTVKIVKFAKDKGLTADLLAIMIQISMEGSCRTLDLRVGTRQQINRGIEKEFISYQLTNQIKNYFLTTKGSDTVKQFNNYISFNKL